MNEIKLLPEILVNQIAAGEVVERPASVLKELVENSLDAGATKIEVELEGAGSGLIAVSDDGHGISREDLPMVVMPHATSKIREEADLWRIGTMGFRGEAMASIASIARLAVRSRRRGEASGFELFCEGGELKQIVEVGMNEGTRVEVRDLFFNTPARAKYLKKEATELAKMVATLNQIALAQPGVSFKLTHNGKVMCNWPRTEDFLARIGAVLGAGTASAMLPIFYGGTDLAISGFVGKPLISRTSGQHQYLFVNGRAVVDHMVNNRIKAAYHSMLMEHRKPVFVLNLTIDPALVDVNVHPRKSEVRFEDQKMVVSRIYGAVKSALEAGDLMPRASESVRYMSEREPVAFAEAPRVMERLNFGAPKFVQESFVRESGGINFEEEKEPTMKVICQLQNAYILALNEDGLVVIDQHAAHEKVRFEELMDEYEAREKRPQSLLLPLTLELSRDEQVVLSENLAVFEGLGFEIEEFGGDSFVVRAVPSCLGGEDLDSVIRGVLDDVGAGAQASNLQGRVEAILTYISCRSAIKFGRSMGMMEMEALVAQMDGLKRPYTCPHGRPTMVSLNMEELARMFGRK